MASMIGAQSFAHNVSHQGISHGSIHKPKLRHIPLIIASLSSSNSGHPTYRLRTSNFYSKDRRGGRKEAQFALKRGRLVVGKRLLLSSNPKSQQRRFKLPISSASTEGGDDLQDSQGHSVESQLSGEENELTSIRKSHIEENGVHLGRRMLLGTVLTAVALNTYNKSGLALPDVVVASGGKAKGNSNGSSINISGGEKEKGKNEKLQIDENWKGSRVYDGTVLGEPVAVGGERSRVWKKLLEARVVYLGEAERVPDAADKVLELGIVRSLRDACFEQKRPVSLALDAFPTPLQAQLDKYMSKRLSDAELKAMVDFWPEGRWQEYLPLLQYCRAGGVRLMACGTPPEVIRTIQAKGIQGLREADKKKYVPPIGGGFAAASMPLMDQLALADVISNSSSPYGAGPYQYSQARIVADHVMTKVVEKGMSDGGSFGMLIVITGASHILYGSKGTGVPARVHKLKKRTQAVVLLNPERQRIRKEGNVPEADFLWYSAAKACNRNCFDRAEVARVMDAAGMHRDALPQDIQAGLERGLVDPEVLKSFFELDQHPIIAELTRRYQGLRERWLADPRFLQRLAIEETISITTTLIAQYERRGDRFWKEIEYVITDSVRGAVVDFFTVWLPAPTLSFRTLDAQGPGGGALEGLRGLLGSVPDNAFQRGRAGESFDLQTRALAVILGGMKLFGVGFISSIGTLSVSNGVWAARKAMNPELTQKPSTKRSPMFKTAFVYGSFLGLSANLRYQAIAGLVEHWVADYFLASQPLAGSVLSFAARIGNSYWGTQQWVDLARLTGLQATEDDGTPPPSPVTEVLEPSVPENSLEVSNNSSWEPPSLPNGSELEVPKEPEGIRAPRL